MTLADEPTKCPICEEYHERCHFTSGSLYCVKENCPNPHHNPPPAGTPQPSAPEDSR